jgi:hypothetical protein
MLRENCILEKNCNIPINRCYLIAFEILLFVYSLDWVLTVSTYKSPKDIFNISPIFLTWNC